MYRYRRYIIRKFNNYKCRHSSDQLQMLPIYTGKSDDKKVRGFLRPITADYRITLPDCAESLVRWRIENPGLSASTFPMTKAAMERWIDAQIISREDRILFVVVDLAGRLIGHLGFADFDFALNSCEVDAVVRGEKQAEPGIMSEAMDALLLWGKSELQLRCIQLKVFSDNWQAIRFYRRCGFCPVGDIPLKKIAFNNEERWEIVSRADDTTVRYYTVMQLEESKWQEL